MIKLDQTKSPPNPAWSKRTAINFLKRYARDRPGGQVLEHFERLDALLQGVMRSTRT